MLYEIILLGMFVFFGIAVLYIGSRKERQSERLEDALKVRDIIAPTKKQVKETKLTNKVVVKTDKDFMGYQGARPFVEFDENWNQMPLTRTKVTIPREHLTRMFPLAYLAGKLSAMESGGALNILLIILIIINVIAAIVSFTSVSGVSDSMKIMNATTSQIPSMNERLEKQNQAIMVIASKLNISSGTQTVGG